MIQINHLSAGKLLTSHEAISPEIATSIARNRPASGYSNMRELQSRNPNISNVWDSLEPLIDFQPDAASLAIELIARKYGNKQKAVALRR